MKELHLQCGRVATVSDVDYERCMQYKWRSHVHNGSGKPYVCTTVTVPKRTTIYLHRFIVGAPPTMKVDHRNRDSLINERWNLIVCSFIQNNANREGWSLSGFKGVSRQGNKRRYRARIAAQGTGESITLGWFDTAEEAARAYDAAAHAAHGEFAYLNFPDDYPRPNHDIPDLGIPF